MVDILSFPDEHVIEPGRDDSGDERRMRMSGCVIHGLGASTTGKVKRTGERRTRERMSSRISDSPNMQAASSEIRKLRRSLESELTSRMTSDAGGTGRSGCVLEPDPDAEAAGEVFERGCRDLLALDPAKSGADR